MSQASDVANALATALLAGTDFSITLPDFSSDDFKIPEVDSTSPIFSQIERIGNEDLTVGDGSLTGSGTFDLLMRGLKAHLKAEFESGRITGQEYTKAYIASTESAMSTSAQFLLTRDSTFWAAVTAQLQAQRAQVEVVTARVQLESEKTRLQVLRLEALNQEIGYALNKLRLATENVEYDAAAYNLANILPQQYALLMKQVAGQEATNVNLNKQGILLDDEHELQPKKILLLQEQIEAQEATNANLGKQGILLDDEHALQPTKALLLEEQVAAQEATNANLGKQGILLDDEHALQPKKALLLQEQIEAQRAQTLDTRTDGVPVTGSVGKQKQLYDQQITSYQRDAEIKAGKIFSDAWTVMKTIDEGLNPPTSFANANLDDILTTIKTNNNL